ncbi:MAG: hypothetical protein M5U19_13315 [Microthrixaceae bacterium]|nr:hypothetical protein [Microthrixaceae bacterium]
MPCDGRRHRSGSPITGCGIRGVLAEVDRRGLCDIRYGTATGVWFERRHGRSRTAVNREIRAGRRLRADLDELFEAAGRGEITFERAAFIAARSTTATRTRSVPRNTRC